MKVLLLILCLIPSVLFAEKFYPNVSTNTTLRIEAISTSTTVILRAVSGIWIGEHTERYKWRTQYYVEEMVCINKDCVTKTILKTYDYETANVRYNQLKPVVQVWVPKIPDGIGGFPLEEKRIEKDDKIVYIPCNRILISVPSYGFNSPVPSQYRKINEEN